jgi:hypothetical protein
MWRRLLARVHPDTGVDADLFVWCRHLQEYVVGDAAPDATFDTPRRDHERPHRTTTADSPRVPFEAAFDRAGSFDELTRRAVAVADGAPAIYGRLLLLLADCHEAPENAGPAHRQQHQGATYKQLAAIGHRAGMDKPERTQWYALCESIPLSQRHAGHILGRLQQEAA